MSTESELRRWRRLEPMLEPLRFLLERIYPEDIFNSEMGDPGAVAVTRIRKALADYDADESTVDLFGKQLDAARFLMDSVRGHLEAALIEAEEGGGDLPFEVREAVRKLDWSANPEHVILYETELGRLRQDRLALMASRQERVEALQRSRRRWIEAIKASIPEGWNAVADAEKAVREVVTALSGLHASLTNSLGWMEVALDASSASEPTAMTQKESKQMANWLEQVRESLKAATDLMRRLGLMED